MERGHSVYSERKGARSSGRRVQMSVIQIDRLKKYYGRQMGIEDVSFSVEEGEIFGFVGPNGAGKSTTIKLLLGFIRASGGAASIKGLDVQTQSKEIKGFTGYVPCDVRLYPRLRVEELLRCCAAFYETDCREETERLCALFQLDTEKQFHALSTGNKKKVSILCALMANPQVIILDEPTTGLDPVMQKHLFAELKRQAAQGTTILLSSHNLAEVQEYCSRVAFIKRGEILSILDLSRSEQQQKKITVLGGLAALPAGVELVEDRGETRILRSALEGTALLEALLKVAPDDFTVEKESMEERFWALYGREERE